MFPNNALTTNSAVIGGINPGDTIEDAEPLIPRYCDWPCPDGFHRHAVHAVNVNLSGLITSQCVLSLSTPGTPAASKDGKRLGSTEQTPGNLSQRRIACTRMYEIEIARMLSEIDLLRLAAE